jgi:CRP/FNR family cyclic AMP-dependent transcriptional regulator
MVHADELSGMHALQDLDRSQTEKLAAIATKEEYPAGTVLFRHKQKLTHYNLLLEGSVALTIDLDQGDPLTLGVVEPGRSFGISALIRGKRSTANAICQKDSTVIHLSEEKMLELFEQDGKLGYCFMFRVLRIFKSRMNQRTRQFLVSLEQHPEIQPAFQGLGHISFG